MKPTVVVITGMHRSGTSLAANLLRRAGIDVGDRLIEAADPNPHGYFEDADFVEFHEQVLKDRSCTILVDDDFTFEPTPAETSRAGQLIAARVDAGPVWGWKDPRTALFLDFWESKLEGARYAFIFRHPLDVLVSLLRRREYQAVGLAEAVRAWETYNRRMIAFHQHHAERCILIHADCLTAVDRVNRALERIGITAALTDDMVADVFRPAELRSSGAAAQGCFDLVEPEAARLYEGLCTAADVAPPERDSEEPTTLVAFRDHARELLPRLQSHRRGLLLTLLELLEPTVTEAAFAGEHEWVRQLEEARQWLDSQRLAWQERAERLESRRLDRRLGRLARRLFLRGRRAQGEI